MKRAIFSGVALAAILGGCSPSEPGETVRPEAVAGTGWVRPPVIRQVRLAQASLIFSGEAEPGARVVLRGGEGAAYAAAADDQGRFEIRMVAPAQAVLLRPETQVGQEAAGSPDRLLVLAGGRGPIALLRSGGPTRRLDPGPALDAIDSDGLSQTASGRAAPGTVVRIEAGGEAIAARSDASGRWSVMLGRTAPGEPIRVGGTEFVWPGPGAADDGLRVDRTGAGWRVAWSGPGDARQWTWMPDAPGARFTSR